MSLGVCLQSYPLGLSRQAASARRLYFYHTMANYVSNSVQFIGERARVAEVRELFLQIKEKQQVSNQYHLPDFVSDERGHMLDIAASGEWLNYETRWAPNLNLLQEVARHYELGFIAATKNPLTGCTARRSFRLVNCIMSL